ncbi:MAG: hypothetical protein FWC80_00405 [Firmicutes bacterium]|nr:hypothetical protein [Bacillota bacterium]
MIQMDYSQIKQLKEHYGGALVFLRVGDFYECYDDHAVIVSKELDLTLIGRDMQGAKERVPMTGVPFHVLDEYTKKLIEKGYRVAVAESLEQPLADQSKNKILVDDSDHYYDSIARASIEKGILDISQIYRRDYVIARSKVAKVFSDIVNKDMSYIDASFVDPISDTLFYEKIILNELLLKITGEEHSEVQEKFIKEISKEYSEQISESVLVAYGWDQDGLYEKILSDTMEEYPVQDEQPQKAEQLEQKSEPSKNIMIKSQVEGWDDWSTETLPENVRKAAEWLIRNGYEDEPDVKNAFYDRETSAMSDDYNAEKNDNAAIVRVFDKYFEFAKAKEGACPICGVENLDYGDSEIASGGAKLPWNCNDCGGSGIEWHDMEFGEHYNIVDKDGYEYFGSDFDSDISEVEAAYEIYKDEYYDDHDESMTPACFNEFVDNEWQEAEIREYYLRKIESAKSTATNTKQKNSQESIVKEQQSPKVIDLDIPKNLNYYHGHEFSSGSYAGKDYLAFQRVYLNHLKKLATANSWELARASKRHYEFSAFIKNNKNHIVYMSISDVRGVNDQWFKNVLVRTARHEKDYTGGRNNFTSLPNLASKIGQLFEEIAKASAIDSEVSKQTEISTIKTMPIQAQENVKEDNKEMGNMKEELANDPIFGEGAEVQADNTTESAGPPKLSPEEFIEVADAEFIKAMREGKYDEIINGLADLGYSVRNVMLIKNQLPNATKVAGVSSWNYQKRSIVKGEKALKILAPNIESAVKTTDGESSENAESGDNTPKYRLSFVFDVSQTHGKDIKGKAITAETLDKHYEGIKQTIQSFAKEYEFSEGENGGVNFKGKKITIKSGQSKEDTLKAMIRSVVRVHTEGRERENGNEISQGRAMFHAIEGTAATHIVSRRLGLGDTKLKTVDFTVFDDEDILKVSSNLNNARVRAARIASAVELYISGQESADGIRKVREEASPAVNNVQVQRPPIQNTRVAMEAGG